MRVLLAGESWTMHTIHQKGFDSFTTTAYAEGHQWLSAAIKAAGHTLDYLPSHLAHDHFPATADDLATYDVVILSDIGANTLTLPQITFVQSIPSPNRLESLRQFVNAGGGLVMVGGYLTFQGIEGKAKYGSSPVEAALPITMLPGDDRNEVPQGVAPTVTAPDHPIAQGLPLIWPAVLGYNRVAGTERGDRGGRSRLRSLACGMGVWQGPLGCLRERLRTALGTTDLRRVERLCDLVAADCQLGWVRILSH